MNTRIFPGVALVVIAVCGMALASCGNAGDQNVANVRVANVAGGDNKPQDVPDKPDKPDRPDKPDQPNTPVELGDVPTGELEEQGLVFPIKFERGEGSVVFSRQNDLLRVEVDARMPYSAGDGQWGRGSSRGSSVDLVLSVDGLNGRHLFYYPSPLWYPNGEGRMNTYRLEASFSADSDHPPTVMNNQSFVGEGDVAYWDRWTAVLWVDLRYVLVAGNSPGSVADTWRAGLILGNEVASEVLPAGMDRFNPGKTPDRMIQFKVSDLPEIGELDENPKDRLEQREKDIYAYLKNIDARAMLQDHTGVMAQVGAAAAEFPTELWVLNLHAKVALIAMRNNLEGVDMDYFRFQRAYVDACPGQSSAHIDFEKELLVAGRYPEAKTHADKVFASGLCKGRALTDGHMRLEWARLCISWGLVDEAEAQLKYIAEHPEMLKDDAFRIQYGMQQAELAMRRADSAAAVAIYDAIMKDEHKHLNGQMTQQIQRLATIQRAAVDQWKTELTLREADASKTNPRLTIETAKGKIVVELFEDDAPNTTASLVSLARKKYWDGLNFHRVEPNFVAQGGCPNGDGGGGPGYRTKFEENKRRHFRGTFAMARSEIIDSQGSQFYICVSNAPSVVTLSDNKYLVVGRVIEGMDVADSLRVGDKITSIRVDNLREHEYVPEIIPE